MFDLWAKMTLSQRCGMVLLIALMLASLFVMVQTVHNGVIHA